MSSSRRLEGRVALVTGAARRNGIGRAIALTLAEEGADVVVNDLGRAEEAAETVALIRDRGGRAATIDADVSKIPDCRRAVGFAIERFGWLDILVNNAGYAEHQDFFEITEADYDRQLDLHLKGPFFMCQASAAHMRERGYGRIVNICSELVYLGYPLLPHFTAAKAGLRSLTKSLALLLAPEITVNAVSPGPTATDKFKSGPAYTEERRNRIPLKRWGRPEDVARSVLFLVSEDGAAYTGQNLDPNCGAVMP